MSQKSLKSVLLTILCAATAAFAQVTVVANNVGYERTGVKRAIVQSASAITATEAQVVNAGGTVVRTITLGPQQTVDSWSGNGFRFFKVADFTPFNTDGDGYRVRVGTAQSFPFAIGEKILQAETGADQITVFRGMRNTDTRDRNLPIFGSSRTHNIYGGWWDATGDPGKHLSHLAYSNYLTPQQIPMVAWALLHAMEMQPDMYGAATRSEAAWGADYLLRALAPEGYFFMSVFDNWGDEYRYQNANAHGPGTRGPREICAWGTMAGRTPSDIDDTWNGDGLRTADYQSAMREGAGVSIAALARTAKAGISGDSSAAQYLAGARRAYAHLKANPTRYQDNGRQNIIDFYCGLLAASELFHATDDPEYRNEAREWADKLLGLQTADGWFYSGPNAAGDLYRPFYHAAEEGFPVVALWRYYYTAATSADKPRILDAVRRNLLHYHKITYEASNPFEYAKMYRARSEPLGGGGDIIDVGGAYTITIRAENYTSKVGDFRVENGAIGWIVDGHSATYEFNADHADRYRFEFMVATGNQSSSFAVNVNGTNAGTLSFNNTNGWSNFRIETLSGSGVQLRQGPNTIRLDFQNAVNVEFLRLVSNNVVIEPPSDYRTAFFMPKVNETGYWWQGENARLASMSSAFILGAQLAEREGGALWADTLFGMATAQLDWILGRNPFDLSMMYGIKGEDYPPYPATQHIPNIRGGICNGISSARANEDNIEWMPYTQDFWRNWRFIEQWLPHNAWYLVAISSLSHRIDNPVIVPEVSVRHSVVTKQPRLGIKVASGRNIRVDLPFAADSRTELVIYNMQGRKVFTHAIDPGARSASIKISSRIARGMYVVSVKDMAGKNVASGRVHLK